MGIHNPAQRKKVMAKLNVMKMKGFTGYSISLDRKVKVSPSDRIEVVKRKLRNGNESITVVGHTKTGKIPRIVGQY